MPLAALGGILAGAAGTSAAATAGAWGAIGAGTAAATGLVGASKQASGARDAAATQSDAATKAAKLQTDAANHAADLKAKADADTLAFTKQQAALDEQRAEAANRANYDQWKAKADQHNAMADMIGVPRVSVPSYVPLTPNTTGPTSGAAAGGALDQATFMKLVQGKPATPQSLAALEPQITAAGGKVLRNAAGIAGKVQLGNGQIVDVGQAFSSGDPSKMAWQWSVGGGPGSPSAGPTPYGNPGSVASMMMPLGSPQGPAWGAPGQGGVAVGPDNWNNWATYAR